MSILERIFKTKKPVIGMVHFKPLLGCQKFVSLKEVEEAARFDLKALQEGGVDGIMFENNYDLPHKIEVEPHTIASFTALIERLRQEIKLPFGINVLWNDFKASLSIAKVSGGSFVRIPVFVDEVETAYGRVKGKPREVLEYKRRIKAESIALFVDIHVKHAKILSKKPLEESALEAVEKGADALVITGNWTADPPALEDLKKVKKVVGDFPILIGSGADRENVGKLLRIADGVIVGTSLKQGRAERKEEEVNIKSEERRIEVSRVKGFMEEVRIVRATV